MNISVPEGLNPPNYTFDSNGNVVLSWVPPAYPNGQIISYTLISVASSSALYSGVSLSFVDSSVVPGQTYSYYLIVSTSAGSASSATILVSTPERIPVGLPPPVVIVDNSTAMLVTWTSPSFSNGFIFTYRVVLNATVVFSGLVTSVTLGSLSPYSVYAVQVSACNSAGCLLSSAALARTLAAGQF